MVSQLCATVLSAAEPDEAGLGDAVRRVLEPNITRLPVSEELRDVVVEVLDNAGGVGDRALALRWLGAHHLDLAESWSRDDFEDRAPISELGPLAIAEASILGGSGDPKSRAGLLSFALRCAKEEHQRSSGQCLAALTEPRESELERVTGVLNEFASRGWPIGDAAGLVGAMSVAQAKTLGAIENADWLNAQVMPLLAQAHGPALIDTMTTQVWPDGTRSWLIQSAAWHDYPPDEVYPPLLGAARDEAERKVVEQVVGSHCRDTLSEQASPQSQMPLYGLDLLLREALTGESSSARSVVVGLLGELDPPNRLQRYERLNFKRPSRATRLAHIICEVDVADAVAFFPALLDAGESSAEAFAEVLAEHADEDQMQQVVATASSSEGVLRVLAGWEHGPPAVTRLWAAEENLHALRALVSAGEEEVLVALPATISDTSNDLGYEVRAELLGLLSAHPQLEIEALTAVLRDASQNELVEEALGRVDAHPAAPADLVEAVGLVATRSRDLEIRRLCYSALGSLQPSRPTVDSLLRRHRDEVESLHPDVRRAIDRQVDSLRSQLDGMELPSGEPLDLLTDLVPGEAVPYARLLLRDSRESDEWRLAIEILGHHGNEEDAQVLEELTSSLPDREVREAAESAIRRLRIGDIAAAHEALGEQAALGDAWANLDSTAVWSHWSDALVEGLDRVAVAQGRNAYGTAIDQLGEVAKVVLYRAVELAEEDSGLGPKDLAAVVGNTANFGAILGRQSLTDKWRWVKQFAALYEMRTEHLSEQGSHEPYQRPGPEDLATAQNLFGRGLRGAAHVIVASLR